MPDSLGPSRENHAIARNCTPTVVRCPVAIPLQLIGAALLLTLLGALGIILGCTQTTRASRNSRRLRRRAKEGPEPTLTPNTSSCGYCAFREHILSRSGPNSRFEQVSVLLRSGGPPRAVNALSTSRRLQDVDGGLGLGFALGLEVHRLSALCDSGSDISVVDKSIVEKAGGTIVPSAQTRGPSDSARRANSSRWKEPSEACCAWAEASIRAGSTSQCLPGSTRITA